MTKYKVLLFVFLSFAMSFVLWTLVHHSGPSAHLRIKQAQMKSSQEVLLPPEFLSGKRGKKKPPPLRYVQTEMLYPRIIYNRVGKCGSRSMQNVIAELAMKNGFQFYLSSISNQTRLPPTVLRKEIELILSVEAPVLYSRHIAYINFEKYGLVSPVYINMIRDPIDRFSSQYHFKRNGDMKNPGLTRSQKPMNKLIKELDINDCVLQNYTECSAEKLWYIVPYFCGQDVLCKRPSAEALQRAKRHLLDNYLAVGFVEDFEGTLQVFEKLLPFYFKGAVDAWKEVSVSRGDTSTYKKKTIKSEVRVILHKRMEYEYDFYRFAMAIFKNLKSQLLLK